MKKKIVRRSIPESTVHSSIHANFLLNKIYRMRGVQFSHEVEYELNQLLPWQSLKGIEKAIDLLEDAIFSQKKILIVGDFDADGATGTAVAIRVLKSFGLNSVEYLVPNRFSFGYGLTPGLVEQAKVFSPDIILTVDNGIANHEGVLAAKNAGFQVIITDHHLPGETLPKADAIVNPNQEGDVFLSKNIAGVGVIFYVMLALRSRLREKKFFQQKHLLEINLASLLDIVALGTVADVVPLDQNNRILVYHGLRRMRAGHMIPGIRALLEISQRDFARLQTNDLSFFVAPRLNAAGRLDDMSLGIECLLTDDLTKAREMASSLSKLNIERRSIEKNMHHQALSAIEKIQLGDISQLPLGLCLFEKSWHQGVIGIVAGRIKDKLHRPVIAFAEENASTLKGSARSIPKLHIRDTLADIHTKYPTLIQKFGGHAMAAGLTLARDNLESFSEIFHNELALRLTEKDLQYLITTDGALPLDLHTVSIAEMLQMAAPWGQHFPEPLFDDEFDLLEQRLVGEKHLKMTLGENGYIFPAIFFNINTKDWPDYRCQRVHVVYRLDINEYRYKRTLQLNVEYLEKKY